MIVPRTFAGRSISISHLEELRQFVLSLRPVESPDLKPDWGPLGVAWRSGGSGSVVAEDLRPFGLVSINAGTATFRSGRVLHGSRIVIPEVLSLAVAGGTQANPVFVAVKYDPSGTGSASLVLLSEYPTHTASYFYRVLVSIYQSGGTSGVLETHHVGDIDFTQFLAP